MKSQKNSRVTSRYKTKLKRNSKSRFVGKSRINKSKRNSQQRVTSKSKQNIKSKKEVGEKLTAKEQAVQKYIKSHRLLKLSDFRDLQPGQPVVITFIYDNSKIQTFTFKFNRVEPAKFKFKKWYTHNIFGSSKYTQGLPLGVNVNGTIRYAESSDYSPAYLDKPIKKIKAQKIRPSPTLSATLFKTGTKKLGNDGNIWLVTETVNKVKRWKLIK